MAIMNRQNTTPIQHSRTRRRDIQMRATSGRAGKVMPVAYVNVLRGDRVSGRVDLDVRLAELAKPLMNGAIVKAHAWLVPKSAHPQFAGLDEFRASYSGGQIKTIEGNDGTVTTRNAPPFYRTKTVDAAFRTNEIYQTLGLHTKVGDVVNVDLLDAVTIIDNFRRRAVSNKLDERPYFGETSATNEFYKLPRAFWLHSRWEHLVPDYEQALVDGQMTLELNAGELPLKGLYRDNTAAAPRGNLYNADGSLATNEAGGDDDYKVPMYATGPSNGATGGGTGVHGFNEIVAELENQSVQFTLAQLDAARETAAFARMRQSMAGSTGDKLVDEQTLIDELMRGLKVPEEAFKAPILLGQKVVPFGMTERHATDAANLDQSVTVGQTMLSMNINTPVIDPGGIILVFVEVIPERLDERAQDHTIYLTDPVQLPDALRDTIDPDPVDPITNRQVDVYHGTPDAVFGFQPRNAIWDRKHTALGGKYWAPTPGTQPTENRFGVWIADVEDPTFTEDWYLVPDDLSHYPFADQEADSVDVLVRGVCEIEGLTVFGDPIHEDQGEYEATLPDDPV